MNDVRTRYQWPVGFGPEPMKKGEKRTLRQRVTCDFWPDHAVAPTCKVLPFELPFFVKKGDELAIDVTSLEDQNVVIAVIGSVHEDDR